jgi:hypothetical protein
MSTESNYWQALRKRLKDRVYTWKINASYVRGVPDWWASGLYQDLWIENKKIDKIPVRLDLTEHKKHLTLHQQQWLEDRHSEGRHVAVVVFSPEGHIYLPGLSWQKPISRLAYTGQMMSMNELSDHIVEILGEKSKIAP